MSSLEIREIVTTGIDRLGLNTDDIAVEMIAELSQGLPYITHLLSLHSCHSMLDDHRRTLIADDVSSGITLALEQWQHGVKKAYNDAVQSSQPGNIYKQVLLACALAEADDLGYFVAAALRRPLKLITGKDYDIPNYAQHLKNFSDDTRGPILERTGSTRRRRYRFISPLHRPYITIKGVAEEMISHSQIRDLKKS